MAEVLGVIASGMSVVSLGIQVAESIQKLRAFYALIREAPTEILILLDELETLSLILGDIDRSVQEILFLDPRTRAAVIKSYRMCSNSGEALRILVRELENGIGKGKKGGGFKMALKKDKLEEIRKRLESSKATMLLANQCYNNAIQRQNWESHERDMVEIKAAMRQISGRGMFVSENFANVEEADDRGEEVVDNRPDMRRWEAADFGANRFTSCQWSNHGIVSRQRGMKTLLGMFDVVVSDRGRGTTTKISLNLPAWIHTQRYQFSLLKCSQGWDHSFRSYRVVSFDAPVFHYCMTGNVAGLQQLFETGQSSPFEVDPEGRTPLHYAALYSRPKVCRFLLDNSADANMQTSWHGKFGQSLFDRDEDRYYPGVYTRMEKKYRGLPAYSTPLHLLVTAGHNLLRQVNSENDVYSPSPVEEDFCETIKVLVLAGHGDCFYRDQYGSTVFGSYTGPSEMFQWLRQYEEAQVSNLSVQEVHELLFSQMMTPHWNDCIENIRQIVPEGRLNKEITNANIQFPSLLCVTTVFWLIWKARGDVNTRGCEKLIVELINAGSNLHSFSRHSTILLALINASLSFTQSKVRSDLRSWLHVLVEAGVDLVEFGQIENAFYDENRVGWTFTKDIEIQCEVKNNCRFEILELRTGATPEDFDIIFEDLYVSAQLARQFWEWVEHATVPDREETMPGTWCDD